jgi:DNA repair exonuclease SbcCD ATPase subunit
MILFKTIKFRNFLSTGNQFTEIKFDKNKTTLVVGTNGSGKSTLLDALCFVLFNKAFRKVTKNQLINTTNEKDCLVEIDFSIGTTDWKIIRGIKPNIFEIYKDGKLLDQNASSNEQQQWLEDMVLKLNYKSFTQIVILGSASFVPFMQLSTSSRREIVEDLLDIKIFSFMNSVIKEKIKLKNDNIKDLLLTKQLTEEKISMQKDFIKSIEEDGQKNISQKQEKIKLIKKTISELNQENEEKNQLIANDLNVKLNDLMDHSKKLKQLTNLKGKITQKIKTITDDHKFFIENTVCPTCTQNIDESFRLNKIEESQNKAKELKDGYQELTEAISKEEKREIQFTKISKKIAELNNDISSNNFKVKQFNKQTKELDQEIQEITSKVKNRNVERDALNTLEKKLDQVKDEVGETKEDAYYYEFINQILKDGGIKAKIIKKYLPLMNKQINHYLQLMDFYINFSFDEEFKETIKSPIHEDFTYESFSEGEKMRINLAILFTWREIARIKNSVNTNLLILDEVFDSSLDGTGIDYFTKIIRYILTSTNVFVISHKTDEMMDLFDEVIKFEKIKGFSKILS